jgi:hypothetical protein
MSVEMNAIMGSYNRTSGFMRASAVNSQQSTAFSNYSIQTSQYQAFNKKIPKYFCLPIILRCISARFARMSRQKSKVGNFSFTGNLKYGSADIPRVPLRDNGFLRICVVLAAAQRVVQVV